MRGLALVLAATGCLQLTQTTAPSATWSAPRRECDTSWGPTVGAGVLAAGAFAGAYYANDHRRPTATGANANETVVLLLTPLMLVELADSLIATSHVARCRQYLRAVPQAPAAR